MKKLLEVWKPIKGFEGLYELSNYGKVKSLKRLKIKKDTIRNTFLNDMGYPCVTLCKDSKTKVYCLNLFVWDTFGDKERNGKIHKIDNIDNNKENPRIDNLQMLSNKEMRSKRDRQRKGKINSFASLNIELKRNGYY